MLLRRLALAGVLAGASLAVGTPSVPAASQALLMPSPTPSAAPIPQVPRGPRIYKLPFPGGSSFDVCQGNNHVGGTHVGLGAYAWDFCMAIGSPVTAARGGTVLAVRQSSHLGGWGAKFADDANYVVIDHGDGSAGLYMHLMMNGARVQVGDHVQTGQLIAYSGNTGWTSAPHLHFMVMQSSTIDWYTQSMPVLFLDVSSDGGLPLEDHTYTSGNAKLDARYFTPTGPPPFVTFWVETFRTSTLWSGPDNKAVQFGPAPAWQFFEVTAPQQGSRLQVTVGATGLPAFISAADVGPSGPPPASPVPATTAADGPPPGKPAAQSAAPAPGGQVSVAAGDTLFSIAKAHQISLDQLLTANHLADPNRVSIGQTLILPGHAPAAAVSPEQVTVAAGDTLSSIAGANHIALDKLANLNKIDDPNHISVGEVLNLR